MVPKVTFDQARIHYRKTRFDAVRMLVKRPLYLTLAAACFPPLGTGLALGAVLSVGVSALFEGVKYAINRARQQKNQTVEEQLLTGLIHSLKAEDAPAIAHELLKSTGRGEKIFANEFLSRLEKTDTVKYQAVAQALEQTYKGRKLLGIPFRLFSTFKSPGFVCGSLIFAADQALKHTSAFTVLDTSNVSDPLYHAVTLGSISVAYVLARGRAFVQAGLSLMFWGGSDCFIDKMTTPEHGVINLFHLFNDFNLGDVAIMTGVALLVYGIIRDR